MCEQKGAQAACEDEPSEADCVDWARFCSELRGAVRRCAALCDSSELLPLSY
jgi:hypothetical protein